MFAAYILRVCDMTTVSDFGPDFDRRVAEVLRRERDPDARWFLRKLLAAGRERRDRKRRTRRKALSK